MLLPRDICQKLNENFGKYYEATLERIDGTNVPVHHTGTDYITLIPKDTDRSWSYIREKNPAIVNMIDLGGCDLVPYLTENYRFVIYNKKAFEPYGKLQLFMKAVQGHNVQIDQVITNIEQLYNQEVGGKKHLRLKNIGYMAIDFTIRDKVTVCNAPDC